jgi:hypothetical protein
MYNQALIGFFIGALAVGLAIRFASKRVRQEAPPATRAGRAFYAALTFALVQLLLYGNYAVTQPGGAAQFASNGFFTLLAFTFGSFLLFGMAEWMLGLFRPERSAFWAATAVVVFALVGVGALAAPTWLANGMVTLRAEQLLPLLSAGAAALVWWAFLPPPPERRPTMLG